MEKNKNVLQMILLRTTNIGIRFGLFERGPTVQRASERKREVVGTIELLKNSDLISDLISSCGSI